MGPGCSAATAVRTCDRMMGRIAPRPREHLNPIGNQDVGRAMNQKLGIWIDHKRAVIVSASADRATARTVESGVEPRSRYSDSAGYPTPDGRKSGEGETKRRACRGDSAPRARGGKAATRRAPRTFKALSERVVGIETADKLTDRQIVAKVTTIHASRSDASAALTSRLASVPCGG
jgi:hypothetical protein